MKKYLLITAGTLVLTACSVPRQVTPIIQIQNAFDEAQAQALVKDGTNKISGNAFLRQAGGGVVTCAGNTVSLIPATEYAKERMIAIYGGQEGVLTSRTAPRFNPDVPAYRKYIKTTPCDSRGDFEFDKVADGEFFLTTTVSWLVGGYTQGSALMQKVTLSGGKTEKVIMHPR